MCAFMPRMPGASLKRPNTPSTAAIGRRLEPTTRLADSEEHDYRFQVDRGQGEVTVAVRVKDEYDNEAVAKTVVK